MEFKNIEEIKGEFNIQSSDIREIRKELKSKLKNVHPDKIGQNQWNSDTKDLFLKINSAIEFIDNITESTLVPIDQVTELVKVAKDLILNSNQKSTETEFSLQLQLFADEQRQSFKLPKISAGVITAILSFVWLFPKTVEDHPVLSRFISFDNSGFVFGWFITLCYVIAFWIIIIMRERRSKLLIKSLKSDRTQIRLIQDFSQISNDYFSKHELVDYIASLFGANQVNPFLLFRKAKIDLETAESLATVLLEKLLQRKLIIEYTQNPTISENYKWIVKPSKL